MTKKFARVECMYEFKCGNYWEHLEQIDGQEHDRSEFPNGYRYCPTCKTKVFKVETEKQFQLATEYGYCVAIPKILRFILDMQSDEDLFLMKKTSRGSYISYACKKDKN